jgi:DNA helicase-2/ATP-dependent DNA helicase PcrA
MSGRPPASLLEGLNPPQREAVCHGGGPLLVLAGAGSGKTRVITHRIAHLVLERGVPPWRIVAVTFTNKAAGEMRERVSGLLGAERVGAWIGTFHSLCLRILRRHGDLVGLRSGFHVYDTDDQTTLIKRILKEEAGDDAALAPRAVRGMISRAKNAMETPEDMEARAFTPDRRLAVRVWRRYDEALARANAADFDDLLLRTLALFRTQPDVARGYAERCEHLLVDEYQDTNRPQYLLVRALTAIHGNVCVVGDDDQCIYRFRGAELRNILDFERDHPGTLTVRLEQNYRSTGTILRAAGGIIARNAQRMGKTLWTDNREGDRIEVYHAVDDRSEAAWVAGRLQRIEGAAHDEIAVLYRTNAQSRQLEEAFRRERIPYQVVGSLQFYARKEIKDVVAYLKLAANPADDVSFRRVVNTPARGIGDTTLDAIESVAGVMGLPLMEAAGQLLADGTLAAKPARSLEAFLDIVRGLRDLADTEPVDALVERVIEATGYESYLERAYGGMAEDRIENVRALVSAAAEMADETRPVDPDGEEIAPTLQAFLDRSALVADADEVGQSPGVTLMTIHCAKGLEYPYVFLVGMEEQLFPHAMVGDAEDDVEEERRLCYVAITRAMRRLFVTHARLRRVQGAFLPRRPSRFLDEIPRELVEPVFADTAGLFDDWTGDREPYLERGSSAARAVLRPRPAAPLPIPARKPAAEPASDSYGVGTFVKHPRFGGGRIVDREGSGKNLKLTIRFSDHGPKKILPAYTKLQVQD